jgi:hypothetical protein
MSLGLTPVQLAIGLVCCLSASMKLAKPRHFVAGVRGYSIVPSGLAGVAATLVIMSEVYVSASHLTGSSVVLGAAVGSIMFSGFVVVSVVTLRRGAEVDCHCGIGGPTEKVSARTVRRAGLLAAGELALVLRPGANDWHILTTIPAFQETLVTVVLTLLVIEASAWFVDAGAVGRMCARLR